MPTLRFLRDAGGSLTTDDLKDRLNHYFGVDIGQLNVISNMDSRTSLISRRLVDRQILRNGEWRTYNDHLLKEEARGKQRLVITLEGSLLLDVLPADGKLIPANFGELLTRAVVSIQERAADVAEAIPQRDEADRDVAPVESDIASEAPKPPQSGDHPYDPEARRQANARRVASHHELVSAFTRKAQEAGISVKQTRYADALVRTEAFGAIFEMKTVRTRGRSDLIRQVRAAIAQLYHYRFLHRKSTGFEGAVNLYAVFDAAVTKDLIKFLRDIHIAVITYVNSAFQGEPATQQQLPWLFK